MAGQQTPKDERLEKFAQLTAAQQHQSNVEQQLKYNESYGVPAFQGLYVNNSNWNNQPWLNQSTSVITCEAPSGATQFNAAMLMATDAIR